MAEQHIPQRHTERDQESRGRNDKRPGCAPIRAPRDVVSIARNSTIDVSFGGGRLIPRRASNRSRGPVLFGQPFDRPGLLDAPIIPGGEHRTNLRGATLFALRARRFFKFSHFAWVHPAKVRMTGAKSSLARASA